MKAKRDLELKPQRHFMSRILQMSKGVDFQVQPPLISGIMKICMMCLKA